MCAQKRKEIVFQKVAPSWFCRRYPGDVDDDDEENDNDDNDNDDGIVYNDDRDDVDGKLRQNDIDNRGDNDAMDGN